MQTRKREHLFHSPSLSLFLFCHRIRKWIVTTANIGISALVSSSSEQDQPWKSFAIKDIYYLWEVRLYVYIYEEGYVENSENAWKKLSEKLNVTIIRLESESEKWSMSHV
jgi:steroid 5-alpha reductase family enzyme